MGSDGEFMIYWITGRANSGKTTLAYKMAEDLKSEGKQTLILDGDEIRELFPTGFSDDERRTHILNIAKIASIAEAQGIIVIIALISPTVRWRTEARSLFKESKLIYLSEGTLWSGTSYEEPTEEELREDYCI